VTPDSTLHRIDGSALRFHLHGEQEQPRSIVLMLHGAAANGGQFLRLAERLSAIMPDALFVMPDAPNASRDVMDPQDVLAVERERPDFDWERSRNWVRPGRPVGGDQESQRQAFVDMIHAPVRALGRLADLLLARHELPAGALAVYGFSQGGMMALYLAFDRAEPCSGVVAHSGQFFGGLDVRSRPRTLYIVGELEMAPDRPSSQVMGMSLDALRALDIPFEQHVCAGLGHGMNEEAVERIGTFLAQRAPGHAA